MVTTTLLASILIDMLFIRLSVNEIPFLVVVTILLCSHQAFSQKLLAGNSISVLSPSGNFGERYDGGFGVGFNAELGIIKQLGLTGEFGWSHWNGTSNYQGTEISDRDTFNVLVGGKIGFWLMYLEARTGYYFGG